LSAGKRPLPKGISVIMSSVRNRPPLLRKSLAIAALPVLGACHDDARPTTSVPMALTSTEEVASLRGSGPGYTRHDPLAQHAEIMAIRLGPGFETGERAVPSCATRSATCWARATSRAAS
jgi:hypothetical protein